MGGGSKGGGTTTTVQSADPWSGAQPFLNEVFSKAANASNNTSAAPYGGRFVTGATQNQWDGAWELGQQARANQGSGNSTIDLAKRTIDGQFLNNNPYLQNAIDATVRPTVNNAREVLLPAVGSAAQKAGAYGGSRQAFLEARTMQDVNQTVADTAAKMWNENYGRERSLQQLAPQMLSTGQGINENAIKQLLTSGDIQRQGYDWENQNSQAAFEDDLNRYWRQVNPYAAIINGGGQGSSSRSSQTGAGSSALAGGITGALGGGAMGGMLAGASGGMIGGPVGIGIGALLGGLAGAIR